MLDAVLADRLRHPPYFSERTRKAFHAANRHRFEDGCWSALGRSQLMRLDHTTMPGITTGLHPKITDRNQPLASQANGFWPARLWMDHQLNAGLKRRSETVRSSTYGGRRQMAVLVSTTLRNGGTSVSYLCAAAVRMTDCQVVWMPAMAVTGAIVVVESTAEASTIF